MRESDNEILARAYETLRRVDAADRAAEWHPANPRGLTVKTMNRAEFNAWCDAGRPPLTAPVAMVPKSKVDALVARAIAEERASTQASLEALAVVIGEECGRNERALRADFKAELEALRAEIGKGVGSDDILDLPDWRSYAAH